VTAFMVDRIDPRPGELLLDPACGTGGFLTSALHHMRERYVKKVEDEQKMQEALRAVEKKQLPHMLCVTNMLLHGIENPSFVRHEMDGLESKVADAALKLDQLPALLDKEKSFKKLGLEKELEQVRVRETQRAYVTEANETIEAIAGAAETFRDAIDDLEAPDIPADCPPEVVKGFAAAVAIAKKGVAKAAEQAQQAIEQARKAFLTNKTTFDQSIAADEHAFNGVVNKLPALKGKTVAQLTTEYKKVSSEIAKLKPLANQKTANETRLLSLNQDRANLLEKLAKARNTRWTALSKAVKSLNKRLDGQLRVEFEPGRVRSPLTEFFLDCRLVLLGHKRNIIV
jgi:N-6 DNA Methylase